MQGSPSFRLWAGIAIAFASHGAFAATTLTMTTEYPATSMPGQGVSTFADLVRGKSGGQVLIDASFDAARGIKSGDMIDAVQARKSMPATPSPARWRPSIRFSACPRCHSWPTRWPRRAR